MSKTNYKKLFLATASGTALLSPAAGAAMGISSKIWDSFSDDTKLAFSHTSKYMYNLTYAVLANTDEKRTMKDICSDVLKDFKKKKSQKFTPTVAKIKKNILQRIETPEFCGAVYSYIIMSTALFGVFGFFSCTLALLNFGILQVGGWFVTAVLGMIGPFMSGISTLAATINYTGKIGAFVVVGFACGFDTKKMTLKGSYSDYYEYLKSMFDIPDFYAYTKKRLQDAMQDLKKLAKKKHSEKYYATFNSLYIMMESVISYTGDIAVALGKALVYFNSIFGYILYCIGFCNIFQFDASAPPDQVVEKKSIHESLKTINKTTAQLKGQQHKKKKLKTKTKKK